MLDYAEHALSAGGDALAAAYVECEVGAGRDSVVVWGVGTDANIVAASLKAVLGHQPSQVRSLRSCPYIACSLGSPHPLADALPSPRRLTYLWSANRVGGVSLGWKPFSAVRAGAAGA